MILIKLAILACNVAAVTGDAAGRAVIWITLFPRLGVTVCPCIIEEVIELMGG